MTCTCGKPLPCKQGKGRRPKLCADCRLLSQRRAALSYYHRNREQRILANKAWRAANPEWYVRRELRRAERERASSLEERTPR
jgi:hypothetical protein